MCIRDSHSKEKDGQEIIHFCKKYNLFENRVPLIVVPSTYSVFKNIAGLSHIPKVSNSLLIVGSALLSIDKRVLIAGQEGMVGSAVYNVLKKIKYYKIIDCPRKKLDLTNLISVEKWFKKNKPDIVINCAGRVGGILANSEFPTEFLNENILIQTNLIKSAFNYNIKHFINLGSSCIYPKNSKQPIKEEYLLTDSLEKTNEAYALAKIIGKLKQTKSNSDFFDSMNT